VVWLVAVRSRSSRTDALFGAEAEHMRLVDPAQRASNLRWHRGESRPRQHFDDRRGRWSDTSTRGHRSHGPSRDRAVNRARAVRNADATELLTLPMEETFVKSAGSSAVRSLAPYDRL